MNFIRRVTFNVGRVAGRVRRRLTLGAAVVGGTPPGAAGVQKVIAFVQFVKVATFSRSCFLCLLVIPEEGGGRVCFYDPRVQACVPAQEKAAVVADPLKKPTPCTPRWVALPFADSSDGQQVVCYRSYTPHRRRAVLIALPAWQSNMQAARLHKQFHFPV